MTANENVKGGRILQKNFCFWKDRKSAWKRQNDKRASAKSYRQCVREIANNPVVQEMKNYTHHGDTSCFRHCVHVSYYNWLICRRLGWDSVSAAKAGLLHDLFLYDWHDYKPQPGERLHGFEHPLKALNNAKKSFVLTPKEEDMIVKHMFPLTLSIPKYKETWLIVMTDKFCSLCEVLDGYVGKH